MYDCWAGLSSDSVSWRERCEVMSWMLAQDSGSGVRWTWGFCVRFAVRCWVSAMSQQRLRVQPVLSPVSVHIQLPVPASEWGGLQGEEHEACHKNAGFAFSSPDDELSLCVFQVKAEVLSSRIFAREKNHGRIWSFRMNGKSVHGLGEYKYLLSSSSVI